MNKVGNGRTITRRFIKAGCMFDLSHVIAGPPVRLFLGITAVVDLHAVIIQ